MTEENKNSMNENSADQKAVMFFKKIRISKEKQEKAAILFLLGVFFLLAATPVSSMSKKTKKAVEPATENINSEEKKSNNAYLSDLENKLEQIIGSMEGAGRVQVMITLKDKGEKILDKNQPYESENRIEKEEGRESESTLIKSDPNTVLVESEGNTVPIVIQERYPEIEGVLVICEGGDNKDLAVHIKEAVQALFSIEPHKIVVYKLKSGK